MKQHLTLFFVFLNLCLNLAEYVGNPDDSNNIERPCAVYDIRCIRKFFAKHSNCSIATGPAPDPYIRPQATYYLPRSNTTIVLINQEINGLNGRIEEFFFNKETDNVVIAIDFRLNIVINDTYYIVHRRAREPVVTVTSAVLAYGSVVITAVIPKINDMQLDQFEATGFVNDVSGFLLIGPGIFGTTDPGAIATLIRQEDNLPVATSEQFLTDATFYAASFIQYNICDFGLNVL